MAGRDWLPTGNVTAVNNNATTAGRRNGGVLEKRSLVRMLMPYMRGPGRADTRWTPRDIAAMTQIKCQCAGSPGASPSEAADSANPADAGIVGMVPSRDRRHEGPSQAVQDRYHPAMDTPPPDFARVRELSPRRNTTSATAVPQLVDEQLRHFSIDPASEFGRRMAEFVTHLYDGNAAAHQLWDVTLRELADLDGRDRVARFNAKRFLCFQLAKILDTLQHPLRKTYQSLLHDSSQSAIKGPYPIFDNVTALFSATPVVTRTATYMYACTEWVEDAFKGREPLLEIYSRLLNPTSISLANHIVDLEAGPLAGEYLAWNFNSGMAAIDATLANLVGYNDVVLSSRNVYGGTYQLLHDWYGKKSNLDVAVEWFDGFTVDDFGRALQATLDKASRPARTRPPHLRLPRIPVQPARLRARRARPSAARRTSTA